MRGLEANSISLWEVGEESLMADTIKGPSTSDLTIKKSRFLGRVEPARNRQHALELLAEIRRRHPNATHLCWALMAGGESAAVDDGEPSGTAGRPMLDVLRFQKLEGVLASVVRYYGGINLGAGGLVRAYTDAVAQALKQAERVQIIALGTMCCRLPFAFEGLLRAHLVQSGLTLVSFERTLELEVVVQGAEDRLEALIQSLQEKGQGRIRWSRPCDNDAGVR